MRFQFWRPSVIGELVFAFTLLGHALFIADYHWMLRVLQIMVGFTCVMAVRGCENNIEDKV